MNQKPADNSLNTNNLPVISKPRELLNPKKEESQLLRLFVQKDLGWEKNTSPGCLAGVKGQKL